jgi:hypothetical protein
MWCCDNIPKVCQSLVKRPHRESNPGPPGTAPCALTTELQGCYEFNSCMSFNKHLSINSTKDLSNYHLQFIVIITWLISKGQLGDLEQQRAYIRAFQSPLLSEIMNFLQLKNADHHPNVPHKVEAVYEAACFVLQGYSSFIKNLIAAPNPQPTSLFQQLPTAESSPITTTSIQTEDLSTLIAGFTRSIIEAIHSTQPQGPLKLQDKKIECNYCGEEHFIHDCPHVEANIKCKKCRRNQDGEVVLSTGAFISKDITGKYICDCINK